MGVEFGGAGAAAGVGVGAFQACGEQPGAQGRDARVVRVHVTLTRHVVERVEIRWPFGASLDRFTIPDLVPFPSTNNISNNRHPKYKTHLSFE
jgi:hypothetical protein